MADKKIKSLEETFSAEKEILKGFFKIRIKFKEFPSGIKELMNGTAFHSVGVYEYDENVRNHIRFFIKGFLLYLDSLLRMDGHYLDHVEVTGRRPHSMNFLPILAFDYSPILRLEESMVVTNDFLEHLNYEIYKALTQNLNFCGVGPFFNIVICIEQQNISQVDNEKVIKVDKIFKAEECAICLVNKPNVLFCSCGHLCICNKCNKIKRLYVCPACRTRNTILRIIE